jgi:two-component system, NtrC family, nitrogen regulation sensor histidine kinase GlnL
MRDVPWDELLAHVADGLVVTDENFSVRWMNPAAERLFGWSTARVVGMPLAELFEGDEEIATLATRARVARSPVARDGLLVHEVPIDAVAVAIGEPASGLVITLRDRTVARALEADARRADRLESLAGIAAGIAHEVKNPLGGIRGAAQLLARSAAGTEREYLELIVREVDRIARLVDRLKDLSTPESGRREPVDVNRLVHESVKLQALSGRTAIDLNLDPSLPPVQGDPEALQRLFLNLLLNALDAASSRVTVSTRVETGRRFRDRDGELHPLVRVAVEDDGAGVAADARTRLFQPFFTTKPKGTGLGLAIAQRITSDHEGTIALEDPSGRGARFVVTLPATREKGTA